MLLIVACLFCQIIFRVIFKKYMTRNQQMDELVLKYVKAIKASLLISLTQAKIRLDAEDGSTTILLSKDAIVDVFTNDQTDDDDRPILQECLFGVLKTMHDIFIYNVYIHVTMHDIFIYNHVY